MSERLPPRSVERLLDAAREEDSGEAPGSERYRLVREIGRGGMGVVHEAVDAELGRRVAVKVLSEAAAPNESARLRLAREARAAARLTHPHIAAVHDATDGRIVMQLVEGQTLEEARLGPRALAATLRDAALAIHYAHGEGVVHRDLKPANLMIADGHVFVMDFGLAKERAVDASLSASGSVVGTPSYMAPEQAAGQGDAIGPRTDVYGLGATLYHGLTGRAPFEEEGVLATLRAVAERDPPHPRAIAPAVPGDLATIARRCMEKEPARRYASALALAGDLERWLAGEPILARPPSLAYLLRRALSRRQGVVVASLVAAAIVLAIVLPLTLEAQRRRALADRVFALAEEVTDALHKARERLAAGAGFEESMVAVLEEAVASCRAFLEDHDVPYAHLCLGRLLHELGRHEEALAELDRAAEGDPDLSGLARERGLVLAELYRDGAPAYPGEVAGPGVEELRRRGAEELRRSIDPAAEPTAKELYAAGMLAWLEGDEPAAIRDLKAVAEVDPTHLQAHQALARLYFARRELASSSTHSWIATDLMSGHRAAYVPRLQPTDATGQAIAADAEPLSLEGAEELFVDFTAVLRTHPGTAASFGFRGQVQARRALRAAAHGDARVALDGLESAVAEFDSALTIDPELAAALVDRGACHAALARLRTTLDEHDRAAAERKLARADYDRSLELAPELVPARFDRALLALHRADLARVTLDRRGSEAALAEARADLEVALAGLPEGHLHRPRIEAASERARRSE